MGLFWGNDKKQEPMPAPPAQKKPEEADPRMKPLCIGVFEGPHGFSTMDADGEFGFLIRDIADGVTKNNNMICRIYDWVKEIAKENKELRERVNTLEKTGT